MEVLDRQDERALAREDFDRVRQLPQHPIRNRPDEPLLRMRLEKAMERVPEGMRRVLVLHDVEGYTHEEIAEMLGVATGTCKSQLFKARARLRTLLQPGRDAVIEEEVCRI